MLRDQVHLLKAIRTGMITQKVAAVVTHRRRKILIQLLLQILDMTWSRQLWKTCSG